MMTGVAVGKEKEGGFRITVNDKILVHLFDYARYQERPEMPREVTQQGIAETVNARRSHVSLALSTLRERGLVEERTVRVTDEVRRRKGYSLTSKGYEAAKKLVESYYERTVRIEDAGGVKEVRVSELPEILGEKYYLVDVLCCTNREGTLDVAQLLRAEAEVVRQCHRRLRAGLEHGERARPDRSRWHLGGCGWQPPHRRQRQSPHPQGGYRRDYHHGSGQWDRWLLR